MEGCGSEHLDKGDLSAISLLLKQIGQQRSVMGYGC